MSMDPFATAVNTVRSIPIPEISFTATPSASNYSTCVDAIPLDDTDRSEIERAHGFKFYDLRPATRDGKTVFGTTWIDIDESGNYDPQTEGKQLLKDKEGKRPAPVQRDSNNDDDDGRRPRGFQLSKLAARQRGESMIVTLKLTSKSGKVLIAEIPNNWPGEHHNILSDEYAQKQTFEKFSSDDPSSFFSRRLRKRLENGVVDDDQDEASGALIPDPLGDEIDLVGHPAARGCVACRKLGIKCPLIEPDSTWPCHVCIEDDCDCELITPPTTKSTCEECRRKRLLCSYVHDDSDTKRPCTQCTRLQSRCVAGPGPEGIRKRIIYGKDYTKLPPPDPQARRFITCTACRARKKSCSLHRKTDMPPCDGCLKLVIPCTFENVKHKKQKRRKIAAVAIPSAKSSKKPDIEVPTDTKLIHTALCHPIQLMIQDADPCHWCQNASYGILGLGWKDVLVRPSANGLTNDELAGGYADQAQQPSTMCLTCSMQRLFIMGCAGHEMRPLDEFQKHDSCPNSQCSSSESSNLQQQQHGKQKRKSDHNEDELDLSTIDLVAIYERLKDNAIKPKDKFCSLCPNIAIYSCCTPQENDMWGDPQSLELPEAEGCGLMLCDVCNGVFIDGEGDLDGVVQEIFAEKEAGVDEDKAIWFLGPRADAEFLLKDGLLIKTAFAGTGEDQEDVMEVEW